MEPGCCTMVQMTPAGTMPAGAETPEAPEAGAGAAEVAAAAVEVDHRNPRGQNHTRVGCAGASLYFLRVLLRWGTFAPA
jgi:hypothetical protein